MTRRALLLAALMAFALAGCGGGAGSRTPKVLRVAILTEPGSLEPGRAVDDGAADLVYNLGDPLVKLGADFEAVPSLARRWEWSPDGKTITFQLRNDGRWTNGDAVTGRDFEWSWKRLLSPELGAEYAYQLFGVAGGLAYNQCTKACTRLRDKVGIEAVDDYTLRVRLTSPQPWFPQQVAHHSFLAMHQPTIERFPRTWMDPKHIVTNGPFKLLAWTHDKSLVLVKNERWRGAGDVPLDRVALSIISDPAASVDAFRKGAVDAAIALPVPPEDIRALTASGDLATYPFFGVTYYGFNLANIPDLNQRRAMAFAVDRGAFARATDVRGLPATGFIPPGMPGFDTITQSFLLPTADVATARELMKQAHNPKRRITLYLNDAPDVARSGDIAREAWQKLGITTHVKVLEWARFLEAMGPPPSDDVDVVQIGWVGDYVDAYNFFQILSCDSENNWWNFCDQRYESLLREATRTPAPETRYRIYARLEGRLTGPQGLLPIVPMRWFQNVSLEKPSIRKTFNLNPHGYVDLAAVHPTR